MTNLLPVIEGAVTQVDDSMTSGWNTVFGSRSQSRR
jgi:hypothetical protein